MIIPTRIYISGYRDYRRVVGNIVKDAAIVCLIDTRVPGWCCIATGDTIGFFFLDHLLSYYRLERQQHH